MDMALGWEGVFRRVDSAQSIPGAGPCPHHSQRLRLVASYGQGLQPALTCCLACLQVGLQEPLPSALLWEEQGADIPGHPGFLTLAWHSCQGWSPTLPAIKSQRPPRTVVNPTPHPCWPGGPSRHSFVLSRLGWGRVRVGHCAPSPAGTPRPLLLGA